MTPQEEINYLKREIRNLEKKIEDMPLTLTGKVVFINPVEDVSKTAGKVFNTQNICLDTTKTINGTPYSNSAMFQFTGDNCKLLEGLGLGDKVEIKYSVKGKIYTNDKLKQSPMNLRAEGCITNLNGYEVSVIEKAKPSDLGGSSEVKTEPGKKPDVIPEGYVWDELSGSLKQKDDLPF